MLSESRVTKIFSTFTASFFIIFIIIFPDVSSSGVSRGLLISANAIIPSLFPFMVCVLMLIKSGFYIKNRVVSSVLYAVFGQNFDMFFTFLLSTLGGYPVGAKLITELLNKQAIDNKTADIMLMYCVNAGPAFIISVVGKGIFNSYKIGVVLLVSHLLSSVIMAIFCGKTLRKNNCLYKSPSVTQKSFSENFVESVADASGSILKICSFIIIFSAINAYLDYFLENVPIIKNIIYFTEVTSAVTKTKNLILISFLLGFSGFSIWCQIFAMSSGTKINFLRFCCGRISHGVISAILTKILTAVFEIKISIFSNNTILKKQILYSNTELFISMLIMLIILLTFIYTKNNSGKIINDVV